MTEVKNMAQVYVKYNPYRLETTLKVNGRDISTDSTIQSDQRQAPPEMDRQIPDNAS